MSAALSFSPMPSFVSAGFFLLRCVFLTLFLGGGGTFLFGKNSGLDAGMDPKTYLEFVDSLQGEFPLRWFRTRGLAGSGAEGDHPTRTVESDREALSGLRVRGVRTVVILRFPSGIWVQGVRPGGGHRLPIDLREVFTRVRSLAETYGDLVDYWEIENEPDIAFVADNPEVYSSFLKACYLAIKSARSIAPNAERRGPRLLRRYRPDDLVEGFSKVMMAPLALPPGPYLERLWANDFFAYTDAFNFHYYGYEEDFSGVYRQFEAAIDDLRIQHGYSRRSKDSPVYLTEYGYGLLDETARNRDEGRARQLRWYESVRSQMNALRPAGTMAFTLRPYFEGNLNEFGLLISSPEPTPASDTLKAKTENEFEEPLRRSPALDFLMTERQQFTRPKSWQLPKTESSSVVVDFIVSSGLAQLKSYGGYLAVNGAGKRRTGSGSVVVYNFSEQVARGTLEVMASDGANVDLSSGGEITLRPFERRVIELKITVPWENFDAYRIKAEFKDSREGRASAVYTFSVFPNAAGMQQSVKRFAENQDNSLNREAIHARRLAGDEPKLYESGNWLVSEGVEVRQERGVWSFTIRNFPPYPLRPAVAELPFSQGMAISSRDMLLLDHKIEALPRDPVLAQGSGAQGTRTGSQGDMFDVYIRTANGNLYGSGGRFRPGAAWKSESIHYGEFTMAFWGRAAMPWKFADNRPIALVFFFRPSAPPSRVTIRNVRWVKWGISTD